MATNGSGIRDTARVLNKACFHRDVRTKKSGATPLGFPELGNAHQEKERLIEQVNYRWLREKSKLNSTALILKVEVDEMESYVGKND